jgi:hypothetical protein
VTTRRDGVSRGAWRELRNATAFAADVARLALSWHYEALQDDVRDALEARLKENTGQPRAPEITQMRYDLLRSRYSSFMRSSPIGAIFDIVDLVGKLWERPDRSANSIANKVHGVYRAGCRAELDAKAIERLELKHRLLDLDPAQRLDANQRLAFEAAWLAGHRTFARQLVERELRAS